MWTDRKNLKKLKKVQEQIRILEEATLIEDYIPPTKTKTLWMKDFHWALSHGLTPHTARIFVNSFSENDTAFADHLQALGEYCLELSVQMRDYWKNCDELTKLRKEEKQLKEKLGID